MQHAVTDGAENLVHVDPSVDRCMDKCIKVAKVVAIRVALSCFGFAIFRCVSIKNGCFSRSFDALYLQTEMTMRKVYLLGIAVCGAAAILALDTYGSDDAAAPKSSSHADVAVDPSGNLLVPKDYRSAYQFLGSWAVSADEGQGSKEIHVVYASPGTADAYRKTGRFADGAVLIKEVFGATTGDMTTGSVSRAETLKGWFVMVKDAAGRHQGPLWGDGWGWSWFDAAAPAKTTSTSYRTDCQSCHIPAQGSDMVYVGGYPVLKR